MHVEIVGGLLVIGMPMWWLLVVAVAVVVFELCRMRWGRRGGRRIVRRLRRS